MPTILAHIANMSAMYVSCTVVIQFCHFSIFCWSGSSDRLNIQDGWDLGDVLGHLHNVGGCKGTGAQEIEKRGYEVYERLEDM